MDVLVVNCRVTSEGVMMVVHGIRMTRTLLIMFIPTQSQPSTEANTSNYDFGVECPYGTKYHCETYICFFILRLTPTS